MIVIPEKFGTKATFRLVVLSGAWVIFAMFAVRAFWPDAADQTDQGQDEVNRMTAIVVVQIIAGFPLVVWSLLLWGGTKIEFGKSEKYGLILAAIVCRLVLLGLPPAQSDDAYRYLWEGRIQRAGMNPFRYAPDAPELESLRDENWRLVNHREFAAIYPPLSQASFLAAAAINPSVTTLKIFFVLCDVLTLLALLRWLARLGRSPAWAALWAFHPSVIVEFSGNGHLDALMVLMVVLALGSLEEGREVRAMLGIAGAIATKWIPLLLLPYFLWRMRRRWLIALVPLLVVASFLPYASAGSMLWDSLWKYQRDWLYNAPIFDTFRDFVYSTNGFHARYGFYAALAALGAVLWFRKASPSAAFFPVIGFYLIAGPVVYPWYLCIFVAMACVRRGAWPWIWLTLLAPIAYLGESSLAVRFILWAPFLAGLCVEGGLSMRRIRFGKTD